MKHKVFLFILSSFVYLSASSQQLTTIAGKVTDTRDNVLSYATIAILNTNRSITGDAQGGFEIHNIAAGDYSIVISAIGYASFTQKIHVAKAGNTVFHFQLADAATELDAVIVTAEKKEENLQHVPISITAISARTVNDFRLWNSRDLTAIVPNLFAGNPGDGRNVTSIRGITSSSYDPAVTTYVDGVSQFTLDTYIPQLFDIERIEVLRGPQGTLYGRNAMGGVINIITKQPSNKTDGFVEMSWGNYGQQRYSAAIRTPIIKDKLFFGASGLYEGMNGFYFNQYNNTKFDKQHSAGGNYYLKYLANTKWAIILNVKHLSNRNIGPFPLAGSAADAFANPFQLNQNAVGKLVDNVLNTSLSLNYSGNHFNFSSQTAYQSNYRYYATPIDGDFSPIDGVTVINNYGHQWNNVKVLTQEFKFSSPAASVAPLKWTAGTYLFYQNIPNKQATHFGKDALLVGSPDSNYAVISTSKAKTYGAAIYAQASYAINKQIDLIAGLRYDYQHTSENVLGEYQPDSSPVPIFETRPDTSATASYNAISPMFSIAYRPTTNSNFYASYSRGYRTGGLTQLAPDPSQPPLYAYKPEYSNNFEIGVKNNLLNNRLRLNVSLFYAAVTNAQVPTLVLPDAITVIRNAGKLDSKGVDVEVAATPAAGFEAIYNFGYTYAKYTSLKISQNGQEADLAGKRQVFTPDITSMLALQYGIPVNQTKTIKIVVRGEWQYLGTTFFDLNNTIQQSPYSLLNTRAGITTRHFELMLWGRNLSDKKYIAYAYDFGAVHLGNPKTYGVTLKVKL